MIGPRGPLRDRLTLRAREAPEGHLVEALTLEELSDVELQDAEFTPAEGVVLLVPDAARALAARGAIERVCPGAAILVAVERDGLQPEHADALRREGFTEVLDADAAIAHGSPLLARCLVWILRFRAQDSELRRAREVGVHYAHHDTLTGLPNREFFRSRLRQLLAQGRRHERQLAVLFLDLDRFKQINDTLGHSVGDELLKEVTVRIQACLRESDSVSRCGGDEFNVILADIKRGQDAARVARKIAAVVAKPVVIDGHELFTSCSIGISLYPADGGDLETLVKHADIAMYQAKADGGNAFRFFLPHMTSRAMERLALEGSLRVAIERNEFRLHYQPQIHLESGRVTGVEALVRWQHSDLGLIYPEEFIPVAEETGLIAGLGEWVLNEACEQMVRWRAEGVHLGSVAVNVSAKQFRRKAPVELVQSALKNSRLDAGSLEIEITESAVMHDTSAALETLEELRAIGIGIAIDDFGTGQSSLSYLKRFPITKLKIDRAFISNVLSDPKDAAITAAITQMAHSLGLIACAEGVETRGQLEHLRGPGCDEVQGYVFSPPLPPDRTAQFVHDNRAHCAAIGV